MRTGVAADAKQRQMIRAHFCLLEKWCDQSIGDPAMAHAFAHRIDARVIGLHRVVDDEPTIAVQPCRFCKRRVGPNADRHYHQLRGNFFATFQFHRFHAPGFSLLRIAK